MRYSYSLSLWLRQKKWCPGISFLNLNQNSGWQLFHPKRSNEPSCVEPPKKNYETQLSSDSPVQHPRLADGPVAEAAMAMAAKTFGADLAE